MNKPLSADRILVVITRRIGDVLLTTPLIHSIRAFYPNAKIDALVFENTISALEGNKDINTIIPIAERPNFSQYVALLKRIFRRYDLAVITISGDKPHLLGLLAAKVRVGILPIERDKRWWKALLLKRHVDFSGENTHTILQYLALTEALGIPSRNAFVPPMADSDRAIRERLGSDWTERPFVVLHCSPKFQYKKWTMSGWRSLIQFLHSKDIRIVMTGSPDQDEVEYIRQILEHTDAPVDNLCGQLSLAETSLLLKHAICYVGPDTSVTHMAAGMGVPTVTMFGPTNTMRWGPMPQHWKAANSAISSPYQMKAERQHIGNVMLIQGEGPCVPCHKEGCDRHINSKSDCLEQLPAERIIEAVMKMLPDTWLHA